MIKKKKDGEDFLIPLDYAKILAPPTKEDLDKIGLGGGIIVGSTEDVGEEEKKDLSDLF